jgi:hypothetical protein
MLTGVGGESSGGRNIDGLGTTASAGFGIIVYREGGSAQKSMRRLNPAYSASTSRQELEVGSERISSSSIQGDGYQLMSGGNINTPEKESSLSECNHLSRIVLDVEIAILPVFTPS